MRQGLKNSNSINLNSSQYVAGFESMKKVWDNKWQMESVRIMPGECYVSMDQEVITTVLGSCISACICDSSSGIGGMNHFLLPGVTTPDKEMINTDFGRYGAYAMELLINKILSNGGRRENLEIKLFGGANVLRTMTNVGSRNIQFIRDYIVRENLTIISEDLGGTYPRKIAYFPTTGKALLKKLPLKNNNDLLKDESRYRSKIQDKPILGDVELF